MAKNILLRQDVVLNYFFEIICAEWAYQARNHISSCKKKYLTSTNGLSAVIVQYFVFLSSISQNYWCLHACHEAYSHSVTSGIQKIGPSVNRSVHVKNYVCYEPQSIGIYSKLHTVSKHNSYGQNGYNILRNHSKIQDGSINRFVMSSLALNYEPPFIFRYLDNRGNLVHKTQSKSCI